MERISQNVANTYATLEALGCDMPDEQNSDNLATTAGTSKVVMFKEQTLTEAQQTQSRKNIGAASAKEVSQISKQKVDGTGIKSIVKMTQAEYDSMASHNVDTLYVIVG